MWFFQVINKQISNYQSTIIATLHTTNATVYSNRLLVHIVDHLKFPGVWLTCNVSSLPGHQLPLVSLRYIPLLVENASVTAKRTPGARHARNSHPIGQFRIWSRVVGVKTCFEKNCPISVVAMFVPSSDVCCCWNKCSECVLLSIFWHVIDGSVIL